MRDWLPSGRQAITPGFLSDLHEARRRGLSLPRLHSARRANLDLLPTLSPLLNGLVLDLGANIGDWTRDTLQTEPTISVIAVEPADESVVPLQARFASEPRVRVVQAAVADQPGEREFFIAAHSHVSSLHRPRQEMDEEYWGAGWTVRDTVRVPVTTIDELSDGRSVALIKLDVQGAEREALAGASDTLKRTNAVLMEVNFVSHYDGDTTFPSLHELMAELGFRLANLSQPRMSRSGAALWSDACYISAH
jgi:FkbM family methyltransferase